MCDNNVEADSSVVRGPHSSAVAITDFSVDSAINSANFSGCQLTEVAKTRTIPGSVTQATSIPKYVIT